MNCCKLNCGVSDEQKKREKQDWKHIKKNLSQNKESENIQKTQQNRGLSGKKNSHKYATF